MERRRQRPGLSNSHDDGASMLTLILFVTAALAGVYAAGYVASVAVLLWLQASVAADAVENALAISVFWPEALVERLWAFAFK